MSSFTMSYIRGNNLGVPEMKSNLSLSYLIFTLKLGCSQKNIAV